MLALTSVDDDVVKPSDVVEDEETLVDCLETAKLCDRRVVVLAAEVDNGTLEDVECGTLEEVKVDCKEFAVLAVEVEIGTLEKMVENCEAVVELFVDVECGTLEEVK